MASCPEFNNSQRTNEISQKFKHILEDADSKIAELIEQNGEASPEILQNILQAQKSIKDLILEYNRSSTEDGFSFEVPPHFQATPESFVQPYLDYWKLLQSVSGILKATTKLMGILASFPGSGIVGTAVIGFQLTQLAAEAKGLLGDLIQTLTAMATKRKQKVQVWTVVDHILSTVTTDVGEYTLIDRAPSTSGSGGGGGDAAEEAPEGSGSGDQ